MKTLLLTLLFLFLSATSYYLDIWFNITPSIPQGIYRLSKNENEIKNDSIILFCLNNKYAEIAKDRKYISAGKCRKGLSPIGKHVIASYPDKVKINNNGIYINGKLVKNTRPLPQDKEGRNLIHTELCKTLKQDEFIVASSKEDSFDSRYYGIVERKDIEGKLKEILVF